MEALWLHNVCLLPLESVWTSRIPRAANPFVPSAPKIPPISDQGGENCRHREVDLNRRELVQAVAVYADAEPKEVDRILRSTTEVITAVVAKGEPVNISGFAKFVKQERPARMGRNPATGEPIRIKASKKARITPLKAFKDAVMSPRQAPKLPRGVWPAAPSRAAATNAKKAAPRKQTTRVAKTRAGGRSRVTRCSDHAPRSGDVVPALELAESSTSTELPSSTRPGTLHVGQGER